MNKENPSWHPWPAPDGMVRKPERKATALLRARRAAFDGLTTDERKGRKRPGSLNRSK